MKKDNKDKLASIIIPNLNGEKILDKCIKSIKENDYPNYEIIVIDNASSDNSIKLLRKYHPDVKIIISKKNLGFSKANNIAVDHTKGNHIVFINNDMIVSRTWLKELIIPIENKKAICTASKIMDKIGDKVLYAGGNMNFQGIGFQIGYLKKDSKKFNRESETLFACGGSMCIKKDIFQKVGGFDEDYFAYYEDVDLGWRLNILGYKVLYCPKSIVYHHHSATTSKIEIKKIRRFHIRNPLYSIIKNYEYDNLLHLLPTILLLSLRRTGLLADFNKKKFNISSVDISGNLIEKIKRRLHGKKEYNEAAIGDMLAYCDLTSNWKDLMKKREKIQRSRKVKDKAIFDKFLEKKEKTEPHESYEIFQKQLFDFFKIKL